MIDYVRRVLTGAEVSSDVHLVSDTVLHLSESNGGHTKIYRVILQRGSGTTWCKMLFPNPVGVTNTVLSLVVIDFNGGCLSRF